MADITMPQLGETVTEGTITRWLKNVGDQVAEDEVLFEVSTDKVDSEVPSPSGGYVSEILVQEGETVDVGTRLAVIADAPPSGGAASAPAAEQPPAEAAAPAPARAEPAAAPPATVPAAATATDERPPERAQPREEDGGDGDGDGDLVLSPVVRKLLKEHDLEPGQIEGTGQGGRITRADVLAYIDQGGTTSGVAAPTPAPVPPRPQAPAPVAAPTQPAPAAQPPPPAPAAPAAQPPPPAPAAQPAPVATHAGTDDETVPFTNIRRRTAEHMVRSKATSAHVLTAIEVDFERVEKVRRASRDEFKAREGFSLTYLPFIARAVVDALHEFPKLNASVGDNALVVHHRIHLGIAVDLNFEGLLVPVIRDAQDMRMPAIAREISELAAKARSKQLSADDISGGTFTITNPGPFGTFITAPVINQPQVAILDTEAVVKRAVVIDDAIAIRPMSYFCLSWDHRALDGALAAQFLAALRARLESL